MPCQGGVLQVEVPIVGRKCFTDSIGAGQGLDTIVDPHRAGLKGLEPAAQVRLPDPTPHICGTYEVEVGKRRQVIAGKYGPFSP